MSKECRNVERMEKKNKMMIKVGKGIMSLGAVNRNKAIGRKEFEKENNDKNECFE